MVILLSDLLKEKAKSKQLPNEAEANQKEDNSNKYSEKVKSFTKYKIGRKISQNVPKYTEREIETGKMVIRDKSVARILSKWIDVLKEYF